MKPGTRLAANILALVAVYFCSGIFGLSMASLNKSASAVWPPTGVALAALLLGGSRLWPGVFAGAFLVNLLTQGTVLTGLGIATGNTLEAVAGAFLANRFADGLEAFERTGCFFRFVLGAAFFSTAISATLGVTSLCLTGFGTWGQFGEIWLTWWLGDMVSDLLVAPFVVIWALRARGNFDRNQLLEAAALFLLLWAIGGVVFFNGSPFTGLHPSLEYLAIPPLLWAAFRFGQRGAITAAALLAGLAVWATRQGRGPFALHDPNTSLLLLQAFMGAITLMALVLALVIAESRRAHQRLYTQEAVTRALAEAAALEEAAPKILQALNPEAEGICGAIWIIDPQSREAVCANIWHLPRAALESFAEGLRPLRFRQGVGLPGQAWKTGRIAFSQDLSSYQGVRTEANASRAGVRSAFAFPLRVGDETPGVIEMFSLRSRAPDAESQLLFEAIGTQVGQFIERKKAEAAQARLAAIAESSADAIIGATLDGRITNWNEGAERIFGYAAAEVLGRPVVLLVPEELKEEQAEILETIRGGKRIRSFATRRLRKNGAVIDVSLTVSPIKNSAGQIIGASKFARDITEQKRTERALAEAREMLRRHADDLEMRVEERTAKLQESVKSLDAFCYTIAHDLRAPLRAIMGFSSELVDRYERVLDSDAEGYLQRIRSAGARMDQLILDLLKLGRLNTADLVIEEVDLGEAFRKVLAELQDEISGRRAQVQIQPPLPRVQASPVILDQVLGNLVSNALKFVPPHTVPLVSIRAESVDRTVRIWIEDNGIGIKDQHLSKLFQPFSRLVSDQDFPGTGIGLAIVSKGIERMGGSGCSFGARQG